LNITIKTKFFVLTALSLLLLAGGVALFTSSSVERNMAAMQEQAAENALNLGTMNVRDQYRSLVRWRVSEVLGVRQFMNDFAATMSLVQRQAVSGGAVLESPVELLEAFHLPSNVGILAFDQDLKPVYTRGNAPLTAMRADGRDIKGRPVASTMRREAREGNPANCVVQDSSDSEYYGTHVWLPAWGWTVGLWIDLNALKVREKELIHSMIRDLGDSLGAVSIGSSGYLFIFSGEGEAILPPPGHEGRTIEIRDADTGADVLERLRQASDKPDSPVSAVVERDGKKRTWQARVSSVKALDWYIVSVAFVDEVRTPGRRLSTQLGLGIAVAALVIMLTTLWLAGRLTNPLTQLASYARKIPEQNFMEKAEPDPLLNGLAEARKDEVGGLATSMLFMDAALRERVQELLSATAARERIEGELAVAHEIQMGMLPKAIRHTEASPAFTLQAFLEPAKEIGGDLYDFFMLDENRLIFAVGDVSGKGVPAALFMSATLSLLRAGAPLQPSPQDLMEAINNALAKDNPRCMFVTLLLGILDLRTGELCYANGGHNYPVLLKADGSCDYLKGISGPLVGTIEGIPYEGLQTALEPGDALFVYTDGVTEAMDKEMNLFTDKALLKTLGESGTTDPGETIALIREAVAGHVRGHPASDDITMLCVRYEGGYEGTFKTNG
jgi:sigma-B regulation protein RsbU (phosphoserine phosphatase)